MDQPNRNKRSIEVTKPYGRAGKMKCKACRNHKKKVQPLFSAVVLTTVVRIRRKGFRGTMLTLRSEREMLRGEVSRRYFCSKLQRLWAVVEEASKQPPRWDRFNCSGS